MSIEITNIDSYLLSSEQIALRLMYVSGKLLLLISIIYFVIMQDIKVFNNQAN